MKNLDNLTDRDIKKIVSILLDSKEEENLMQNPEHEDAWMLAFLYDSKLRNAFELILEKKKIEEHLQKKENNNLIKKSKI